MPPSSHTVDDIWRTLTHAKFCDEIWWLLDGTHPERDTILEAYNRYLNCFAVLRPGIFVAYIILLGSLFDQSPDCITLKSIPELTGDPAFPALWDKGRRLYTYRSKSIAHRDIKNDSIDFAAATGFTYDGLRGIVQESCDLFDRYARANNLATVPSQAFSSGDDLLRIMRVLAK